MICPFCREENTRVLESRLSNEKTSMRRRRTCESCHRRFTTYERVENCSLIVIKKNKSREKFSAKKLSKSISNACLKTTVSEKMVQKLAENIEYEISLNDKKEVSSAYIGEKVLNALEITNEIAYLRYLSIFREYKNIDELFKEIRTSLQVETFI